MGVYIVTNMISSSEVGADSGRNISGDATERIVAKTTLLEMPNQFGVWSVCFDGMVRYVGAGRRDRERSVDLDRRSERSSAMLRHTGDIDTGHQSPGPQWRSVP